MSNDNYFDVIIIGGSYAGLSAAMTLGRSVRKVLVIDSGSPCNRQTPHSHNFLTQDGVKPSVIAQIAELQVRQYSTINIVNDTATQGKKNDAGFEITTANDKSYHAKKLVFATGVKDLMPAIEGFAACWGISAIHCPYCHGYEVKNETTGILANGNFAYHYAQLVSNLTNNITIFTNGKPDFTYEQLAKLERRSIPIIDKEIQSLEHENGRITNVRFKDQSSFALKAIYSRPNFEQHCTIPSLLGCELTEQGHIKVDQFQKTTIDGVFACGDSASAMRTVSNAAATGNIVGAMINNELTEAEF